MNIRALVIAALIIAGSSLAATAQYSVTRSVIGSGMTPMSGGGLSLDGTIGQAIIGPAVGSPFTALQGFWYTMPSAKNGVENREGDAAGFALEQNYPNPFNPSTTIKYSVPERTKVTIRVMNLLGEEVHAPLVEDVKDPGTYSYEFTDADNLPSGTYIYRMEAGTFSASKRMVLLK
jgi:hypothetical protein